MTQLTCTGAGRSAAADGLPDYWTFNVITTAPGQTYTLNRVGVNAGKTCVVDWGDGSATQNWTGDASRSHVYAAASTYTVTVTNAAEIWKIDMRDNKTSWTVSNAAPMPANITYLDLNTVAGLTWNVGSVAGANMPANITSMSLLTLANLTWNVGSVAGANMPANCTSMILISCGTVTIDAADVFPKLLTTLRFENSLSQAQVDAVLAALYLAFPTRTGNNGTIDLDGGGNAAPTGVSPGGAECPPTTGWNTAYELVNDSCGVSAKHWASVTCQV
jgi:hypothetical protein